jgi:DNA-binding transcriptional LysR family regulator
MRALRQGITSPPRRIQSFSPNKRSDAGGCRQSLNSNSLIFQSNKAAWEENRREYRQLRYALAVWRERSFSRASEQLNVSQSSISMQVKFLEDELGFQLFEGTGQGVDATTTGRSFLKQAEQVMVAMLGLADVADNLRGGQSGSLALGLSSGIASQVLPPLTDLLASIRTQLRMEIVILAHAPYL